MISTLTTDVGKYECYNKKPPHIEKKILKICHPENTATSLQRKPERSNEKKIKKPNMYYYYNIKLVSERNQETEKKSIFLSVNFSSLCAI